MEMLESSREERSEAVSCVMEDLLQLERCNGFWMQRLSNLRFP